MTRTVFRGGTIFDGSAARPTPGDVVVEGRRILDVGTDLDGDEAVDCAGLSVLPGLFDCHVHILYSGLDTMRALDTPLSYYFYEAAQNLATVLGIGITTVRDASGADLGMKRAVEDGLVEGPRLLVSLTMLSQTGGHGDPWHVCGSEVDLFPAYPGRPSGIVDGPDEMRRKVRQLIREGADVIKVATSGGVLSPRDDPRHGHFRDGELAVLVEEASAANRFVMAHAQAAEGIKAAVRAGIRSIEHGIYLDDEAIEMMLERGTWLVPTLIAPTGVIAAAEAGVAIPEASVRKAHEVVATHRDSFRRAVEAGVRVAMGTDCPISPHGTNLDELGAMAESSSMSPLEAWRAATSSAAELCGLDGELGTLEPGKRADLVLLDGDLGDLSGLEKRVAGVWKDGECKGGRPALTPS
ncbi:MAG TPA: amidohydrolase family protein [Acidimicrobiales bacterium]|nr:amidohydrolase family protein [Acidimicrobiales bacterium]